jgi:hypothetical protein
MNGTPDDLDAKEAQLRATSDQLLLAIDAVSVLEGQKRGVTPGDDVFVDYARDVRIAAEALLALARTEEEWARDLRAEPVDHPMPTIAETAPVPSLAATLGRWREVERQLADAKPGSSEAATLLVEFERLRREYAATLSALVDRDVDRGDPAA